MLSLWALYIWHTTTTAIFRHPPMLHYAAFFALGCALSFVLPHTLLIILPIAAVSIFMALTAIEQHTQGIKNSPLIIMSLWLLCGFSRGVAQEKWYQYCTLSYKKPLYAVGVLRDAQYMPAAAMKHQYLLQISSLYADNEESFIIGRTVQIYTAKPLDAHVGDTVVVGPLSIKQAKKKSFNRYLMKEGITSTVFAKNMQCVVLNTPFISLERSIHQLKISLYAQTTQQLSPVCAAFFSSLYLGNKATHKKELEPITQKFKAWGIVHYLARSGLHLVMLLFVWQLALGIIPLQFLLKQLLLLIIITLYVLLSWTSTSFARAVLTLAGYKVAEFCLTPVHWLHSISLVSLCFLINNPAQICFLDFQLSFGLTLALAWINHLWQLNRWR